MKKKVSETRKQLKPFICYKIIEFNLYRNHSTKKSKQNSQQQYLKKKKVLQLQHLQKRTKPYTIKKLFFIAVDSS